MKGPPRLSDEETARRTEERYLRDVVVNEEGCWAWSGSKHKGYGCISWNRKADGAHRYSWFRAFGAIPDGLHVLHKCDNPECTRPDHLFLGTHHENMMDRNRKGRVKKPCNKGENNGRALITEHDVVDIRTLSAFGAKTRHLSREFGLKQEYIRAIIRRRTWASVP